MDDKRNLFTAIGLSLLVLVGWQYFVTPRFVAPKPAQIETQENKAPTTTETAPQAPAPGTTAATPTSPAQEITREEALKASPRVTIRNDHLSGSIALKGARIDDLTLRAIERPPIRNSPNIVLFSPSRTTGAFYADFGLLPGAASADDTPNGDTLWQASGNELTPSTPITLTWTNPQGVEFKREITVDDDYMFSVTDTVTNHARNPLCLPLCGRGCSRATPRVAGYYVLFEGLLGYIGDIGLQEWTYAKLDKEGMAQELCRHRRLCRHHHRQILGSRRHSRSDETL